MTIAHAMLQPWYRCWLEHRAAFGPAFSRRGSLSEVAVCDRLNRDTLVT
jgi:hypothetical protein